MPDRQCHDCGCLLAGSEGWIVPLDYPGEGRRLATLDRVPICELCLLGRCGRGTGNKPAPSINT